MTTDIKEPEVDEVPAAPEASEPAAAGSESGGKGGFERVALPVLLPIVIVGTVLFWVLNLSRVLLASNGSDGWGSVLAGGIITVAILGGAAAFAAAPKLRSSSLGMIVAGFCALVLLGGLVTISAADKKEGGEEGAASAAPTGPAVGKVETASSNLKFVPKELEAPFDASASETVIEIDVDNQEGAHTFVFEDPTVKWDKLSLDATQKYSGKAGFPKEGTYTFFCDIPGHRAAGMEGTIDVTSKLKPEPVAG